jgi:small conductance mechanosensitive channel
MLAEVTELFVLNNWWSYLLRIGFYFFLAWLVYRLSGRIAMRLVHVNRFSSPGHRLVPERQNTLNNLIASFVSFIAFTMALLFTLNLFVGTDTLVWMVGLFSAAFGLGARPLISDFLTGIGFLFEDTFHVGEKVEMLEVTGVVEMVNLRTTHIRAPTGELYVMPNGEIRVVRNFSRGRFSTVKITIKLPGTDVTEALTALEQIAPEAMMLLPNLLEPWQVISETGMIGQQTELTLIAKTRFGKAAETQPRLLALVQERLEEAGVALVG